jgi:DNA-binding LytR/AlgR family response regulator
MKLKCLIVEDEPIAREILRSYIEKTDGLTLTEQFSNAIDAFRFLQAHSVDLIFLDIKMPQMNGIELLKKLQNKPKTIITSAFRYYATDAFDLEVIDYLLKPYSHQRFLKAVNKARNLQADQLDNRVAEKPFFFVKGNKQLHKVFFDEVLYVESQRDYLKFKLTDDAELMTRNTIAYYEEFLPRSQFLRIHRSYIIAINKVTSVEQNALKIGTLELPIGRLFKIAVHEKMKAIAGI